MSKRLIMISKCHINNKPLPGLLLFRSLNRLRTKLLFPIMNLKGQGGGIYMDSLEPGCFDVFSNKIWESMANAWDRLLISSRFVISGECLGREERRKGWYETLWMIVSRKLQDITQLNFSSRLQQEQREMIHHQISRCSVVESWLLQHSKSSSPEIDQANNFCWPNSHAHSQACFPLLFVSPTAPSCLFYVLYFLRLHMFRHDS